MARAILLLICLTSTLVSLSMVDCLRCSCLNVQTTCPPTPKCHEYGRRLCGCCDVCKLELGETCNNMNAPCMSGLKCNTSEGLFDGQPPWFMFDAEGQCVSELMLKDSVLTNRRIQVDTEVSIS